MTASQESSAGRSASKSYAVNTIPTTRRILGIWLVPVGLSALLAAQAMFSMAGKSVTVDEIMYIAAGHYHLQTGDFRFNQTNPPLMKMVAAAPLLLFDLSTPAADYSDAHSKQIAEWHASRAFLYRNKVSAETILFASRLPIVAISVGLGFVVWKWAGELYGFWGATLAHTLYCFSPNILAHSRLVTQDLGLTAAVFIALYCFWRYLAGNQLRYLILCGLCLGLGLTIKTPVVLAIGGMAAYGGLRLLRDRSCGTNLRLPLVRRIPPSRPRGRQLVSVAWASAILALIAVLAVNAVYGFRDVYLASVKGVPCPLPASYVQSLRFQTWLKDAVASVYFAGGYYSPGLWYKHVVAFLIKTPLPALTLMVLALVQSLRRPRSWDAEWMLGTTVAVFLVAFAMLSSIGGGLRYILSIYPILFVLCGTLWATRARPQHTALTTVIAALLVWCVATSLSVHPHYLAYFNEAVGGPSQGYKWLDDSDLDWGQDLNRLKQYMTDHSIDKVKLAYFGSADADYHGINYEYLPSIGLAPQHRGQTWWYEPQKTSEPTRPTGTVAISATLLTAGKAWMRPFRERYAWLQHEQPIANVGYSILIYELD